MLEINLHDIDERLARIEEFIEDFLDTGNEFNVFNIIHSKLDMLLRDEKRQEEVMLASKTLDKFEDYMKNVDKLNAMINEFKGCVSMSRAALAERKKD